MEEQPPRPPQQPPDTFGYPPPGYSGPPPGAYPGGTPPGSGYPPYYAGPGGYPPNPYAPYAPPPMPKRTGFPWWGWLVGGCLGVLILGGVGCAVLGSMLGAQLGSFISSVANQQFVTETTTQTFTVTGAPTFVVDNAVGNFTYVGSTGNTVSVELTKRAGDSSITAAQNDLQTINATVSQSGNTISIEPQVSDTQTMASTQSVDIVIKGPMKAAFDISGSATPMFDITGGTGKVSLANVQGVVTTNLEAGDVLLSDVTLGDGSQIQTSEGSVTLDGQLAPGANVVIKTDYGSVDLTLPASTSTHLNATAASGSISITGWSLQPTSQNGGSSITGDLGTNPSGTLDINVSAGSISLTGV